jgi:Phage integrase, N-terminal SAM-like domain
VRHHEVPQCRRSFGLKFDTGRDPVTRKRRIRYATFRGSKRGAETELARLITEHTTGASIDPSKITVSDFLVRWQDEYVAGNVTPKTGERYKQLIKNQIAPHIGQVQLQKLRPHHLTHLYSTLGKAGLAARTIGHVHRLLHRALGHAGTWGLLNRRRVVGGAPHGSSRRGRHPH